MDIPAYLMTKFQLLQATARSIKRAHGSECRTYTKYDDAECELYLETKFSRNDNWLKISPSQAMEMNIEKDNEHFRALKRSMVAF